MKEKIVEVDIDTIQPNLWNPNVVSDDDMEKLRHSIEMGYFQPIVLWHKDNSYIIIDGEHRWRIMKEKGYNKIEALVLEDKDLLEVGRKLGLEGVTSEEIAKSLTYLLNKARGDIDVVLLAEMVSSMKFAENLLRLSKQEIEVLEVINKTPESELEVIKEEKEEENPTVMLRIKLTHQEYEEWKKLKKSLDVDDRTLLTKLMYYYKTNNNAQ